MENKKNKNKLEGQKIAPLLIASPIRRFAPDIATWRRALKMAENPDLPNRTYLYDVYEETMLDGMVTSVTERIRLKCTNARLSFVEDGEADPEHPINKMTGSPQFLELITYIIESKWWGHSLIEFEFEDFKLKKLELIDRKNVQPEYGRVVFQVGGTKGIYYKNPPYSNYLLEVGKPKDLGLLNKATPPAIFKRLGVVNWGEFIELFSIPIRIFKYDPKVPDSKKQTEDSARDMGAGSRIVMPVGSEVEIVTAASNSGNSTTFKEYKNSNDEEIMLMFLLQTMTSKDGSSRSQGEVHERSEGEMIAGYKLFVELVLNYQFIPLLEKHGFKVGNGKFKYDNSEKLSKKELLDVIKGLAQFGDVPLEYIEEHFNIQLDPKDIEPQPDEEEEEDEDNEEEEEENNEEEEEAEEDQLRYSDPCCENLKFSAMETLRLSEQERALLLRLYNAAGKLNFDSTHFQELTGTLIRGLRQGFGRNQSINYNSSDHLAKNLMELNLYRFGAGKNIKLVQELNQLLRDSESFDAFQKLANPLIGKYNQDWLRTEYETAYTTAQQTANYYRNLEQAEDFPYWEYQTVGDDSVRPAHKALDGVVFKAGESGMLSPPNGWNCRCELIPRTGLGTKKLLGEDEAIELLGDEFEQMKKQGFAINRADTGEVFSENQQYAKAEAENLNYKNFGLKKYKEIAQSAPEIELIERTDEEAIQWFEDQLGQYDLIDKDNIRLLDWNGRPVSLSRSLVKTLDSDVLHLVPGILKNADEIYFEKLARSNYKLILIKYYKPKPLVLQIDMRRGRDPKISNWVLESKPDVLRKGLLIKKS